MALRLPLNDVLAGPGHGHDPVVQKLKVRRPRRSKKRICDVVSSKARTRFMSEINSTYYRVAESCVTELHRVAYLVQILYYESYGAVSVYIGKKRILHFLKRVTRKKGEVSQEGQKLWYHSWSG
jgi:hypothetical protein